MTFTFLSETTFHNAITNVTLRLRHKPAPQFSWPTWPVQIVSVVYIRSASNYSKERRLPTNYWSICTSVQQSYDKRGVWRTDNLEEPKNPQSSDIKSNCNMMQYTLINVVQLERKLQGVYGVSQRGTPWFLEVVLFFVGTEKFWARFTVVRTQGQQKRWGPYQ